MDLRLKGALVGRYGSQSAASRQLGINERRLSRIIHGYETPRPEEQEIFRKKLGIRLGEQSQLEAV